MYGFAQLWLSHFERYIRSVLVSHLVGTVLHSLNISSGRPVLGHRGYGGCSRVCLLSLVIKITAIVSICVFQSNHLILEV